MSELTRDQVDTVLNNFAEAMFRMMVDRYQRHLSELDITMVQAQVLRLLYARPLPTGELATELGISAPAVTQLTDRLIRKRLIERRAAAADRRSVIVVLTPKGKRAIDRFREKRGDVLRVALDTLGEGERAEVMVSLVKMVAALESSQARAAQGETRASNDNGERRSLHGSSLSMGPAAEQPVVKVNTKIRKH
jgi:DNA-binding MarR family transcriptional regulator